MKNKNDTPREVTLLRSRRKTDIPMNERFKICRNTFELLALGLTKQHKELVVELIPHSEVKAEIRLRPDPSEAGKLIGAAGKTVKSLQTIMRAAALQYGLTLFLRVDADDRPAAVNRDRPMRDDSWTPETIMHVIRAACMMSLAYPVEITTSKAPSRGGDYWNIDILLHADEPKRVFGKPVDGMSLVGALKHIFTCIACSQGGSVSIEFM